MRSIELFLNRVIHADCTKLLPLFPSESIDFVCTDPPYLVNYLPRDGRRCQGDDSDEWLEPAFRELCRVLKPDSFCATFYGWPGIDRFMKVWCQGNAPLPLGDNYPALVIHFAPAEPITFFAPQRESHFANDDG